MSGWRGPQEAEGHPSRHAWLRGVPDILWAPLVAGGLVLLAGAASVASGLPWLFASLGPTAYLQAEDPKQHASRLYNVAVGHLIGLLAGYFSVWVLGVAQQPSVFVEGVTTPPRAYAAALSVGLTVAGTLLARASHPPAAATTMLIALGVLRPTAADAGAIVVGVAIVGLAGEFLRRLRLRGACGDGVGQ